MTIDGILLQCMAFMATYGNAWHFMAMYGISLHFMLYIFFTYYGMFLLDILPLFFLGVVVTEYEPPKRF
jgi:hypothetical protein